MPSSLSSTIWSWKTLSYSVRGAPSATDIVVGSEVVVEGYYFISDKRLNISEERQKGSEQTQLLEEGYIVVEEEEIFF